MKVLAIAAVGTTAAFSACSQSAHEQQPSSVAQHGTVPVSETPPIPPPGTGPDAKTPFAQPKSQIDPKSLKAAGQVVQEFSDLIAHNRFDMAARLWVNAEVAAAFLRELPTSTHLEVGEPGEPEGAAGSIYTTVPVLFYGNAFRRSGHVVLRRVNDVPGSTEEQRHWHIERIEWSGRP